MVRRLLTVLGVVIAFTLVVYGVAAGYALTKANAALREGQAQASAAQRACSAQVMADHQRWQHDALFARRDGGDAWPLLRERVGWSDRPALAALPASLTAGLADAGADWPRAALDTTGVDLSFFSTLGDAGFWDLEGPGSPLHGTPYGGPADPALSFRDVLVLAKLRLLRGLASGEVRPALDEVHELARLCLTTESLVGSMVAVGLLELERKAAAEAGSRGLDLGGFPVPSEEDTRSLKRALWAVPHATSLLAPDEPLDPAFPLVGRCAALAELAAPLFIRPFAGPVLPSRYATFTTMLKESDCRLGRLRAAWATTGEGEVPLSGDVYCRVTGSSGAALCDTPDFIIHLPFVRPVIGAVLASTATSDWLKLYRDGGAN
ncbi:MAG: hypothetical protein JNJ54_20965 [Myxococcaceae bacterium]|nr:hypothetical protein [Myxococcaceae bacterium]